MKFKERLFLNFEFKKFKFLKYCFILPFVFIFCSIAFIVFAKIQNNENLDKNTPTIILDAGHGGEDGGAIGLDGTIEKTLNLEISLKIQDLLEASGYKVIMTRENDKAIYDSDAKTLREKKKSDLKNRLNIINKNKEENCVFISIHQNKFPNEKYLGTQIFYSSNNAKSEELAKKIKESVKGLIQPENDREIKPANDKIFLLKKANIPAVIVECGFLSNIKETQKLKSEKYQNQLAFSIYCAIANYFNV